MKEMAKAYLSDTGGLVYGNIRADENNGTLIVTDVSDCGHYKETTTVSSIELLAWIYNKIEAGKNDAR